MRKKTRSTYFPKKKPKPKESIEGDEHTDGNGNLWIFEDGLWAKFQNRD